jgi:hypothetical protein
MYMIKVYGTDTKYTSKYRNWVYGTDTKHMKFLEDNSQYVFYLFYIHFQYLSFPECAILSRQSQSPITAQSPNCPTQSPKCPTYSPNCPTLSPNCIAYCPSGSRQQFTVLVYTRSNQIALLLTIRFRSWYLFAGFALLDTAILCNIGD